MNTDNVIQETWSNNLSDYRPLILVVDDQNTNLQVVGNLLKRKKYRMNFALNGKEALQIAQRTPPDIVLLDVMMPDMDGFEVARRFKEHLALKEIPIIFLTARAQIEDVVEGLSSGGVDYITKPFFSDELLARVKTHIELKMYREQLQEVSLLTQRQNIELKGLYDEKREFISVAAHDLKNPLNAVIGLSSCMILDLNQNNPETVIPLDDETKASYLDMIQSSGEHMLEIINNILSAEKLDSSHDDSPMEEIDLSEITRQITGLNAFHAREKKISLNVGIESNILINGAPVQIRELLDNLISNAVKYSPCNSIVTVSVEESPLDETNYSAMICVKDQGPGFTAEDRQDLFKPFITLSAQPTGDEASTGLGLSIVKKIVDKHNGKITLITTPGKGAEFRVFLP